MAAKQRIPIIGIDGEMPRKFIHRHRGTWKFWIKHLFNEHTSSVWSLGGAVGLGVVIGCSPFFGLHLWIALALGYLLRLNRLAIILGSQISIPPLAPFLGFASVQLGSWLLHNPITHLQPRDFTISQLPGLFFSFGAAWVLGGLLLGIALSLPAMLITVSWIKIRRRSFVNDQESGEGNGSTWQENVDKVVEHFSSAPRWIKSYVRSKLCWDPVFRQICERIGHRQNILDLGTGLGLLPLLLAMRGQVDAVTGVDWDKIKLHYGKAASLNFPSINLILGDVHQHDFLLTDGVIIIDLLHYFPLAQQQELIRRAIASLNPDGIIFIRDTEVTKRSWITRCAEALAMHFHWNKGQGLSYMDLAMMKNLFEKNNFRVSSESSSSWFHRGNFLLQATKGFSKEG